MEYPVTSNKNGFEFILTVVQKSQNKVENSSVVSFNLVMKNEYYSTRWYGHGDDLSYKITINGTEYTGNIGDYYGDDKNTNTNKDLTIKSTTNQTIKHNNNGKKTINVSFSITDSTGDYYTCGSASKSGTFTLEDIPRSSSFTLSKTTMNVEDTVEITINPASSKFTHKMYWYISSSINKAISIPSLSFNVKVPTSFYNYLKTQKSLKATVRCYTYSGTTQIGMTEKEITVNLSATLCKPSIRNIEINNLGNYKIGQAERDGKDLTVLKADPNNNGFSVKVTYVYPSVDYANSLNSEAKNIFTENKTITNLDSSITISNNFFTSNAKTLNDYGNYIIYTEPTITIKKPSLTFSTRTIDNTSYYKVTNFKCEINYSFFEFKVQKTGQSDENNLFEYSYYLGKEKNPLNFTTLITPTTKGQFEIFYDEKDSDIGIELEDLLNPVYLIINFNDKITSSEQQVKEVKLQPLFDWSEEDFKFSVPVEINTSLKAGKGWYSTTNKIGGGINLNNADIAKVNGIYFADVCTSGGEGFYFPTDDTGDYANHYDRLRASGGCVKFTPRNPANSTEYNFNRIPGYEATLPQNSFYNCVYYGSKFTIMIPINRIICGSGAYLKSGSRIRFISHDGILSIKTGDTTKAADFIFKGTTSSPAANGAIYKDNTSGTSVGSFTVKSSLTETGIQIVVTPSSLTSGNSFVNLAAAKPMFAYIYGSNSTLVYT